jgi:Holliday junction resolvase RusA-like endonuclease
MVTLVIEGQLPNLNEYTRACRSNKYVGARMKATSERIITTYIQQQLKGVAFKNTVELSFRWYEPNKKRDLDNICFAKKFILDALVSNGIIIADGWKGVIGFTDNFYVDKENPRIEVDIKEAGGNNEYSKGTKRDNRHSEDSA